MKLERKVVILWTEMEANLKNSEEDFIELSQ
jgi:hypothetical protein